MAKKRKTGAPSFKPYHQGQQFLLPPNIDEMIPESHLVRVANKTIDQMTISPLLKCYKGGGTSSYHPKMMLKIIIYSYLDKTFSVRQMAKKLRENVVYMWLSGFSQPDFRTLNYFRKNRLKSCIDEVFCSLLDLLVAEGYVDLKDYFVDGTKMESAANKHTAVWAKNTQRYKEMVRQKVKVLLTEIDEVNDQEDKKYGDSDLDELGSGEGITSEKVAGLVKEIDQKLLESLPEKKNKPEDGESSSGPDLPLLAVADELQKQVDQESGETEESGEEDDPKLKPPTESANCSALSGEEIRKLKRIRNKLNKYILPRLEKYEDQEKRYQGRKSYSKTDQDATFLRIKDGRILPAYNVMIGTEHQFILNFSVHQAASETREFIPHMEKLLTFYNKHPENVVGDSAYGSQVNYEYIQQLCLGNYLKYNMFHHDEKGKKHPDPFHSDHFIYREKEDLFECPMGQILRYKEKITNPSQYTVREYGVYECVSCEKCISAAECLKNQEEGPRRINYNAKWAQQKKEAFENLTSAEGRKLRKRRSTDVETVFGDIKKNMGYPRFRLNELPEVNVETGLLSMGHNIKKMHLRQLKSEKKG